MSVQIGPVTFARIKPASEILSWNGWPEDVRARLRELNRTQSGPLMWRLTFRSRHRGPFFVCHICNELCSASRYGDAIFDGDATCDECLIAWVRQMPDGAE